MGYRVVVRAREVRGRCAVRYQLGGAFAVERFYIREAGKGVCLHALAAMLTLLAPLLKGAPATALGIGKEEDTGYAHCPDPGEPYTCGGTVIFELKSEKMEKS
ncbi:MAG: TIGR04076 family protein [Thermofilum sp.]|nr:TIGR04076 family protein [Thermofilum sp.]